MQDRSLKIEIFIPLSISPIIKNKNSLTERSSILHNAALSSTSVQETKSEKYRSLLSEEFARRLSKVEQGEISYLLWSSRFKANQRSFLISFHQWGRDIFSHFAEKSNQLALMVKGFSTGPVLLKDFYFLIEFFLVIDHSSDSKSS